ncbi:MAG: 2-oxo-4-hydroxy-4-carboxy-5-ureidoimidazoline decarboxylase [Pseudomonadota bacterium]
MSEFVERYGGVYEHSPWVAERVEALFENQVGNQVTDTRFENQVTDTRFLAKLMADCVDNASHERRLALIRAHPDLAGRAQVAGELTAESTAEQSSAGLDQCSAEEYERFQQLNDTYKEKFGFPFVMAVRNSNREEILDAFAARLENDYDMEFETAIQQIHEIAEMRLQAMEQAE